MASYDVPSNILKGRTDRAIRHICQTLPAPFAAPSAARRRRPLAASSAAASRWSNTCASTSTSADSCPCRSIGPSNKCPPRHVEPRCLDSMASYDMARNINQAHCLPRYPAHKNPSCIEPNGNL